MHSTCFAPLEKPPIVSTALEASRVLKAAPGTLVGLMVYNNNASDRWLQLHNATSAPADGVVPYLPPVKIAAGATILLELPTTGIFFSVGIYACNSSTAATKTLSGSDLLMAAIVI